MANKMSKRSNPFDLFKDIWPFFGAWFVLMPLRDLDPADILYLLCSAACVIFSVLAIFVSAVPAIKRLRKRKTGPGSKIDSVLAYLIGPTVVIMMIIGILNALRYFDAIGMINFYT